MRCAIKGAGSNLSILTQTNLKRIQRIRMRSTEIVNNVQRLPIFVVVISWILVFVHDTNQNLARGIDFFPSIPWLGPSRMPPVEAFRGRSSYPTCSQFSRSAAGSPGARHPPAPELQPARPPARGVHPVAADWVVVDVPARRHQRPVHPAAFPRGGRQFQYLPHIFSPRAV